MVAVIVIAIVAVSYVVSTRIHPLRKCPTCNMSGRHFGGVYKGSYRRAVGAPAAASATGWAPGLLGRNRPHRGLPEEVASREVAAGARPRPRAVRRHSPAGTASDGRCPAAKG